MSEWNDAIEAAAKWHDEQAKRLRDRMETRFGERDYDCMARVEAVHHEASVAAIRALLRPAAPQAGEDADTATALLAAQAENARLREALREHVIVVHEASKQPIRNGNGEIVSWEKTVAGIECTLCRMLPDDGLEHHAAGCLAALAPAADEKEPTT